MNKNGKQNVSSKTKPRRTLGGIARRIGPTTGKLRGKG